MKQVFVIPGKLPTLNDYVKACRGNKYGSNRSKRQIQDYIAVQVRLSKLQPVQGPVHVTFVWKEENRRRDKDNVAFAKKFILDALQECGILPNDNNRYVLGFTDVFEYMGNASVEVILEERESENHSTK